MKTEDELRALKANWQQDPIWNIEDTEGFEDYYDELYFFREQCEERWAAVAEKRRIRSSQYNVDQAIQMIEYYNKMPEVSSSDQMLALAQVHATLAIVAELKRMNDIAEGS